MKVKPKDFDFSGYATKSDLLCSDGRTIKKDAFKANDGVKVPLVWQHLHRDPGNVLGHAILENREDGVYAYCKFNETPAGQNAKQLVIHRDIDALSIYANNLVEKGKIVHSGMIREVSLVLSGANPGAFIDNVSIQHEDGSEPEDEAIIYSGLTISEDDADDNADDKANDKKKVKHADNSGDDPTVAEVFASMNEQQKTLMYAMITKALEGNDLSQSNLNDDEGDSKIMKHNVFDGSKKKKDDAEEKDHFFTHDQLKTIFEDAPKIGSLRQSFLVHAEEFGIEPENLDSAIKHAVTYGIENIDYLFPDAKSVTPTPTFVQRDMGWVTAFFGGSRHTPFSRIKSLSADITLDTARALGYVKGALKKEEFFALAKRTTTPTTVYKKQKLDRDDIIDVTEMDVVAWLKVEMRMLLDEEVARAGLIGDGRDVASPDKIDPACIRPIYTDADLYVHRVDVAAADTTADLIDHIIGAFDNYKGKGTPIFFCTPAILTAMLLLKDTVGRRLYRTKADLAAELRVRDIITVELMTGMSRIDTVPDPDVTYNLVGIVVNPADYTYGADKGGAIGMFDDFDIDYNQQKYLMETRCSGALTEPKTALIIEKRTA